MIKWLLDLAKNEVAWVAVGSIGTLLTVGFAYDAYRRERLAKRPYFTVENPGIKQLPNSPPYRIQITMKNVGIHPATNLSGRIIIIDVGQRKKTYETKFSIANEIPSGAPTPWYNDSVVMSGDIPSQYVVLLLNYDDPILEKYFSQPVLMKWGGVVRGTTHPDFTHVSVEERDEIRNILKNLDEHQSFFWNIE